MTFHLIGDPHLGRKFETGVPQHRRGERESKQLAHFIAELDTDVDHVIMVGDLFDNPHVPQSVVVAAAAAVLGAAERNENTSYWMMAGNHDQPRNLSVTGAWTAFKRMVDDRLPNLRTVSRPVVVDGFALFPWEWDVRADDQVLRVAGVMAHTAVGHWDLKLFDGKDDHLAPTRLLREQWPGVEIHSGHYHVAGTYEVDGIDVYCTGSLEPYTHGEDPDELMYITLTKSAALKRDDLQNKYVRILLAPGEELPEIDCMGLTAKRTEGAVTSQDTLSVDDFDWDAILRSRIEKMDPLVQSFIKERVYVSEEQC